MSDPLQDLNMRQRRFVEEYARTGNGTQSAIAAGYKPDNAGQQAHELLKHPKIIEALGEIVRIIEEPKRKRRIAKIAEIKERLSLIGMGEPIEKVKAIGSEAVIAVRPAKTADQIRALELLCKTQGRLIERRELSGPKGGPIPLQEKPELDLSRLTNEELETLETLTAKARVE